MKSRLPLILLLISISAFLTYLFSPPFSPISPFLTTSPNNYQQPTKSYTILGFVPYWNLKKLTPESLSTITHFAYFNLHLNSDGSLYTHANRREQDPGYTNYQRLLKALPSRPLILTFMPESQAALSSILNSSTNRSRTIDTIVNSISESGAAGVNVDFEPLGDTPKSLRDNFTVLIQELNQELEKDNKALSISVYPSAASRPRLWDLPALADYIDHLVVMTYDYTLPGDDNTGPNSPLRGSGTLFEHDILKNLAEITEHVPSRKVLLGVPFYGYEWDTSDTAKYTPTSGRGAVASLERINELAKENTLELLWDRNSLTPYAIRREEGEVVSQIYFEDENSIKLKLDLVKQADLGGIAIWALGYEGNNPSLWNTIGRSLNRQ